MQHGRSCKSSQFPQSWFWGQLSKKILKNRCHGKKSEIKQESDLRVAPELGGPPSCGEGGDGGEGGEGGGEGGEGGKNG